MADFRLFGDDNASVASLGVMLEGLGKPLHDVDVSGGGGGGTNLGAIQTDPENVVVTSDTGGDAVLIPATVDDAGVLSAADKVKLDSVPDNVGDVDGPASAVDSNFALYAGATGKIIKDTGVNAADFDAAGSAAGVQSNLDTHEADTDNPHEVTAAQAGVNVAALVPAGGAIGDTLVKQSAADFDDAWVEPIITPVGGVTFYYNFSTTITAADPGAGNVRLNSTDQQAATAIFLSKTTNNGNPADFSLDTLHVNDVVTLSEYQYGLRGGVYKLTSSPVDNGTWLSFDVAYTANPDFLPLRNLALSTVGLITDPAATVPPGGSTGEVLSKVSNGDYDTEWSAAGAGAGYQTIENEGTPQIQRTVMNFTGSGVTASDDGTVTVIDVSSGGSGANLGTVQSDPDDIVITSDTGTNATIVPATQIAAGGQSSVDKTKLDGIEPGAQVRRVLLNAGAPLNDEDAVNYVNSLEAVDTGVVINVALDGDEAAPGVNQVYGTNAGGSKVWKDDPGDVLGPGTAVDNNFATFDGITGNIIADDGLNAASFDAAGAAASVQGNLDTHEAAVNPHTSSVGTLQEGAVGSFVNNVLALTQVQYDGLTPVATTLYLITDAP